MFFSYLVTRALKRGTYPSACFVVVEVHLLPDGLAPFPRVDEFPADREPESNVVRAAPPFEVPDSGDGSVPRDLGPALVVRLAVASVDGALAAGPRNRMGHRRTRYGVDESRFSASCNK
jgi:hypothetical protein